MLACFSRASGRDDEVVGKVGCVDAKRDTAHGLARELPGKPRGSGAYRHIFPSLIATLSQKLQRLDSECLYRILTSLMSFEHVCLGARFSQS